MRARQLLPGLLVAATGVGAGDLVTASLAGSEVGLVILWAAAAGAVLKLTLNEGLVRWQLATGTTLLEGWARHLGRWVLILFLIYLGLWSLVVGAALVSACGLAAGAWLPLADDPSTSRVAWGALHALAGLALVRRGGFAVFERVMAVSVVAMFVCVVTTAALTAPPIGDLAAGLIHPSVPEGGWGWVLGVLGGVGGTVTLLSYGYWIREHGRQGPAGLRVCRIDLGVAYAATALFGMAMIVIGSRLDLSGSGAGVALALADQLGDALGPAGRQVFLVGFWGAVFSSLLGVWQGVPYLFADAWRLLTEAPRGDPLAGGETATSDLTHGAAYRRFQWGLALLPLPLVAFPVREIQLAYAVLGALFMPFLAATLLVLNSGRHGDRTLRNRWLAKALLLFTVAFFAWQALRALGFSTQA